MYGHRQNFTSSEQCDLLQGAKMCTLSNAHSCDLIFNGGTKGGKFSPNMEKLDTDIDLPSKFNVKRRFGGGKSGAYVLKVIRKNNEGIEIKDSPTMFLKLYLDAFDYDGEVLNERPFREVYTYCMLNGRMGFSCTACFGASNWPTEWEYTPTTPSQASDKTLPAFLDTRMLTEERPPKVFWVLMQEAGEKTLMDLPINELYVKNPWALIGSALEIVSVWQTMKNRLGDNFTHWDFHPENIFINQSQKRREPLPATIAGVEGRIEFPQVNVIDFDLVTCDLFPTLLEEHHNKIKSLFGITERALQWVMKWVPMSILWKWLSFFTAVRKLRPAWLPAPNEDLFHLLTYQWVLGSYAYAGITGKAPETVLAVVLNEAKAHVGDILISGGGIQMIVNMLKTKATDIVMDKTFASGKTVGNFLSVAAVSAADGFIAGMNKLGLIKNAKNGIHDVIGAAFTSPAAYLVEKATDEARRNFKNLPESDQKEVTEDAFELIESEDVLEASMMTMDESDKTLVLALAEAAAMRSEEFKDMVGHYPMLDNVGLRIVFDKDRKPLVPNMPYIIMDITVANNRVAIVTVDIGDDFNMLFSFDKGSPLIIFKPHMHVWLNLNTKALLQTGYARITGQALSVDMDKINLGLSNKIPTDSAVDLVIDTIKADLPNNKIYISATSPQFAKSSWSVMGTVAGFISAPGEQLLQLSAGMIARAITYILSGVLTMYGGISLINQTMLIENKEGKINIEVSFPPDEIAPNSVMTCVGALTKSLEGEVYLPYILDCLSVSKALEKPPAESVMEKIKPQLMGILKRFRPINFDMVYHNEGKLLTKPIPMLSLTPEIDIDENGSEVVVFALDFVDWYGNQNDKENNPTSFLPPRLAEF